MKLTTLNVVSPVASISLLIGSDVHHFVFTVQDLASSCSEVARERDRLKADVQLVRDELQRWVWSLNVGHHGWVGLE